MGVVFICKKRVRYVRKNSPPKHIILSIVVIRAGNKHENRSTRNIMTTTGENRKQKYVNGVNKNSPQQAVHGTVARNAK